MRFLKNKKRIFFAVGAIALLSIITFNSTINFSDVRAAGDPQNPGIIYGPGGKPGGSCNSGHCYGGSNTRTSTWLYFDISGYPDPNAVSVYDLPNFILHLGGDSVLKGCEQYGGVYVHAYNMYKSSGYTGYWAGPAQWSTYNGKYDQWQVDGAVSYQKAYDAFEAGRKIGANGADWDAGNFGWFCAYDKAGWQSKTQVYSPKVNKFVSSDFQDYKTDEHLKVNVTPGEEVSVSFNSYLRIPYINQVVGSNSTQYYIKHWIKEKSGTYGNVTFSNGSDTDVPLSSFYKEGFLGSYSSPKELTLTTATSDDGLSVISLNSIDDTFKIKIPDDAQEGAKFVLCEGIFYKKKDKTDPPETINQYGTHACAEIIVGVPLNEWQSKTTVTSPIAGTVSSDFIDGQTDQVLPIEAEPGDTIDLYFDSFLRSAVADAKTEYRVTHYTKDSGIPSGFTVSGDTFSGNQYIPKREFTAISTEERSAISDAGKGTSYTVSIDSSVTGGSITLCERINYKKKGKDDPDSTMDNYETHVCAKITVKSNPPTTAGCKPKSYSPSIYKADTAAESKVTNFSSSLYSGWRDYVIAKPGDTIQFCHSLYYGNRLVGKNLLGQTPPSDQAFLIYGSRDDLSGSIITPNYNFPKATATANPKYLGDTLTGQESQPLGGGGNTLTVGYYNFKLLSPGDNASYNCNFPGYSNNQYTEHGFRIPGYAPYGTYSFGNPANCPAATETGNTTEAGHTITQTLKYDWQRRWVKYSHTDNGGPCGCNSNGRNIYNSYQTYDQAKLKTYWGYSVPNGTGVCVSNGTCCTCSKYCCSRTKYKHPNKVIYYYTEEERKENQKEQAHVFTPFNFLTDVHSWIQTGSNGVKFLGESVNIKGRWSILPRQNNIAGGNVPNYATLTPDDSHYDVFEILLPEDDTRSIIGANDQPKNVCEYYNVSSEYCHQVDSIKGPFNPKGLYDGVKDVWTSEYTRQLPDTDHYVGWKYCVGTSMWPSRSHRADEGADTEADNMGAKGSTWAMGSGSEWYNVSSLSCVTIAKKPNFQVWGAGIFTKGKINTSVSKKHVGAPFGTAYSDNDDKGQMFGSWDEYAIIAGGTVNGMASGAALGYEAGYKFNLPVGGNKYDSTMKADSLSPETISNTSDTAGSSGIAGLNSTVLSRLKARFRSAAETVGGLRPGKIVQDDDTGIQYYLKNGGANISDISGTIMHKAGKNNKYNGTNTTSSGSGSALIKGSTASNSGADNTLVIYVKGKLTIDKNICYTNNAGECTNGKPAVLSSYSLSVDSIASLPQIIIFAQEIEIKADVDRVEAWLILDEASGSGELKTCDVALPDHHTCSKTLVITGPVFAKKLTLTRTGGANHNSQSDGKDTLDRNIGTQWVARAKPFRSDFIGKDGSITPAEIFNLRPDAYYWAYNQAQRSTEAVTTYTRELAPRY